jgi:hypothetical protein
MLYVFIICSLFLPDHVYTSIYNTGLCDGKIYFISVTTVLRLLGLHKNKGILIFTLAIPLFVYITR